MRKLLLLAAAICCALPAQVPVTPITNPHVTFVNGSGGPCAGCSLYTYQAGTTTPLATYIDATGTSQNTNPIILDASGGASIWLGRASYKFILKDTLGTTIWSEDQVNMASLFPCSPANSIQIANSGATGLTCDSNITIDTINHTLNVGRMSVNHVTIGALGTPTTWFFDTTSPATALASLGGSSANGTVTSVSVTTANGVSGTVATATTTPAITLSLGAITPTSVAASTSVQIASGVAMTDNQGTGVKVQHSTGATTTNDCAKFDATGNVVDSGSSCSTTAVDYIWSFTSCPNSTGQPSQCISNTTLPGNMPDANYSVHCDAFSGSEPSDQLIVIPTWPLPTTSGSALVYKMVQVMQNGTVGGVTQNIVCHAHHD